MNQNLQKLFEIAQKPARLIIGLMSGTSMDGLDIALCQLKNHGSNTEANLLKFVTVDYTDGIKQEIREVFAKKTIDFQHLALLNEWIGNLHGQMILDSLATWGILPADIDLVASHGQTVMHAPKILHQIERFPNATLQIGDGDHLAVKTGIITLSDFRQKHLAAGGEGAPLAVYGDYFIFSKLGQNRIMLNMGGIGNFTYLPKSGDASEVFVTDTGPGNTLLDATVRKYYPLLSYDKDASIAMQGRCNQALLLALKSDDFFEAPFPKTTGPELFSLDYVERAKQKSQTEEISVPDLMATLTQFSVETIAEAIAQVMQPNEQYHVYMSGGGMHNPMLTAGIKAKMPQAMFAATNDLGIAGDAKEAVLFAILANETIVGQTTNFGNRRGVPSVSMGKISFPT
jgi:anhydro-N-acetylmuramic acid kinase